jgi:cytochrome c-type biogenesis protein CcmH/NrfF
VAIAAVIAVAGSGMAAPAFSQASDAPRHVEGAVSGPIVESPDAMKVTTQIQCFCGTCANQTLHDCTCGLAAMERQKVAAALADGQTPETLIAAYVAEHGPQVRIVPERRGLNLLGWLVPFAAAAAGLLALLGVLRGWQRLSAARAAQAPARSSLRPEAERPYRDRLEEDLKEFDA